MIAMTPTASLDLHLAHLLDALAQHLDRIAGAICDLGAMDRALLARRLAEVETRLALIAYDAEGPHDDLPTPKRTGQRRGALTAGCHP